MTDKENSMSNTASHDDRFALAVSAELPGFTVTNHQGMIVATLYREDGSRVNSFRVPNLTRGDKRKPVSREDALYSVERGIAEVRRMLPHYTPEARAKADEMLSAVSR